MEGAGAETPEAIPRTSILASVIQILTVVSRETRRANAPALLPGATIVTNAWEAQMKREPDLGVTELE